MSERKPTHVSTNPKKRYLSSTPQLVKDLSRVEMKAGSNRIRTIEGKIERGTARPDQIIDWYLSQDPLEENGILQLYREGPANAVEIVSNNLKRARISELAANILLNNCGFDNKNPSEFLERISKPDNPPEFYLHLYTAADMLYNAATIITNNYPLVSLLPDQPKKREPEYDNLINRMSLDHAVALEILDKVSNSILSNKDITNPEIVLFGLEGYWRYISHKFKSSPDETTTDVQKRVRKILIINMVNILQDVFLGDRQLLKDPNLPKSLLRGKLSEFIWALDAHIFYALNGDYETNIALTNKIEDMPRVGFPEMRRGSDLHVWNIRNGTDFLIQLKSSRTQSNKAYHPAITVAMEENFQDTNPGRLHNKLKAYKKYLESGFDPTMADQAKSYILTSVKEILIPGSEPRNAYVQIASLHGTNLDLKEEIDSYRRFVSIQPRRKKV